MKRDPRGRLPLRRCLLIGGAILIAFAPVRAQIIDTTGRWKVFPITVDLPMPVPPDVAPVDTFMRDWTPLSLFLTTPSFGFGQWYKQGSNRAWFRTIDSGKNWTRWSDDIPIPHALYGARGFSSNGMRTDDSGHTWRPILIDSTPVHETYRNSWHSDAPVDTLVVRYGSRMALSTDGGGTWQRLDSLVVVWWYPDPNDSTVMLPAFLLDRSTPWGEIPGIDTAVSGFLWAHVPYLDSEWMYAIIKVRPQDESAARFLLWKRHMHSGASTFLRLPYGPYDDWYAAQSHFVSPSVGYIGMGNKSVARTFDGGITWDSIRGEVDPYDKSLRFLTERYAIAAKKFSADIGATWISWYGPVGAAFFALDSLHLFGWTTKTFLRSTDAGRSWITVDGSASRPPNTVYWTISGTSLKRRVGDRTVRSDDLGETWYLWDPNTDTVPAPVVPEGVTNWRTLSPVTSQPDYVVGYGTTPVTFDSPARSATFVSTDRGMHWQLAGFQDSILLTSGSLYPTRDSGRYSFFRDAAGGVWRTEDGVQWQRLPVAGVTQVLYPGADTILVAREGEVLKSSDGGTTWRQLLLMPAPFQLLSTLMQVSRGVYLGYGKESMQAQDHWFARRTTDAGENWWIRQQPAAPVGIPLTLKYYLHYAASEIRYSIDSGATFATVFTVPGNYRDRLNYGGYLFYVDSTHESVGRWRIAVDDTPGAIEAPGQPEPQVARLIVGAESEWIELPLEQGRAARSFELYDISGRVVDAGPPERGSGPAERWVRIPLRGLRSGTYFARIALDSQVLQFIVVLAR